MKSDLGKDLETPALMPKGLHTEYVSQFDVYVWTAAWKGGFLPRYFSTAFLSQPNRILLNRPDFFLQMWASLTTVNASLLHIIPHMLPSWALLVS